MEDNQLGQLLVRNGEFVRALARSLVRDPHRAEDLVQETWLRVAVRPPRETGSVRHWLRTVVRNLASSAARGDVRRAERDKRAARPEAQPSAAEDFAQAELLRGLVEAVLALEEPYRSTLLARYWRGWSAARVAEETKTPVATVRSREQRALQQLRGKIDADWKGERGAWGLVLTGLLATEPQPAAVLPAAPLAKLGLAAGAVLVGAIAWRAVASTGVEPRRLAPEPVVAAASTAQAHESEGIAPASARESVPADPAVTPEPSVPGTQTFSTPPPSEVRVRFVYSDGTPAAGVACTLELDGVVSRHGLEPRTSEPPAWEDQSATSGSDGRVSFVFSKPADHSCGLQAELPGHAKVSWSWADVAPGQVLELGDATLLRAAVITGRLVRPDGTPILGGDWRVQARSIGHTSPDGRSDSSSGADVDAATGAFRIEGVMPGTNQLSAYTSLSGWIQGPRRNVEEGGTLSADIVHDGPDPTRRIVVNVSMERFRTVPAPLAEHVRLLAPGQAPRTGFVFDDLAPVEYTLEIDDPRCVLWRQEGIRPGTRVGARLQGNSAVVLAVTDAVSGLAVVPARITLTLRNQNTFPNVFPVESSAGGRIDGMFAGDSTIEVRADGRVGSVEVDGLAAGETRAVSVVVAELRRVEGSARFADGVPAAGLEASLLVPAESDDSNATQILARGSHTNRPGMYRLEVARTRVDEAGLFELVAPRAGTYLVHVAGRDGTEAFSASFTVEAGPVDPLEFVLARPGSFSGRVQVPAGASIEGLRVWALPLAIGAERGYTMEEQNISALGADGSFAFASVASGPARIYLRLPQAMQYSAGGWTSSGTDWMSGRLLFARELGTVEIPAGGALEREFTLDDFPGSLELTVRVDGVPVPWLALTLKGNDGEGHDTREVSTDERGVYSGPLFAGTYGLEVADSVTEWRASVPEAIVITRARRTILTVDLER